jgi:hypothetical protein
VSRLVTVGNDELGRLALDVARSAGRGPERQAALCAAAALTTTSTIQVAKDALSHLDTLGRADLRAAAAALIHELATREAIRAGGRA